MVNQLLYQLLYEGALEKYTIAWHDFDRDSVWRQVSVKRSEFGVHAGNENAEGALKLPDQVGTRLDKLLLDATVGCTMDHGQDFCVLCFILVRAIEIHEIRVPERIVVELLRGVLFAWANEIGRGVCGSAVLGGGVRGRAAASESVQGRAAVCRGMRGPAVACPSLRWSARACGGVPWRAAACGGVREGADTMG